ncbi:MAG: MCE family protein [Deltaproteobacteria bacterium]|nr:MCE family protein [Deltaproteobacteria bacterium]
MGRNRFVILGMFVLLAIAMFFYLAFKVGSFSLHQGREVTVVFNDATGLKKGGDVKIKGVNFGKITSLAFRGGKAEVKIRLTGDVVVPRDVEAKIRPESLLGENFLELIIPAESTAGPLRDGDVITKATKAIDMNQFVDKVGHFIDRFEAEGFADNLSRVVKTLADNSGKLDRTIGNLDQLTRDAKDLISDNKESLNRTIHNLERISVSFGKNAPKTAKNLNLILARLEKLTSDLEKKSPDLAENLGKTMKNLSIVSEKLPGTLDDFQDLSGRLKTSLDHVDHFFVEDVPDIKDIMEKRGIKARVRIW